MTNKAKIERPKLPPTVSSGGSYTVDGKGKAKQTRVPIDFMPTEGRYADDAGTQEVGQPDKKPTKPTKE